MAVALVGQDIFTLALERREIKNAIGDLSVECQAAIDQAVAESLQAAKDYIDDELSNVTSFELRVVDTLPPLDEAQPSTIYFVPKNSADPNNYEHWEYILVDGKWELIGNTEFNISDYLTKTEASDVYVTKEDVRDYIDQAAYELKPATSERLGGVKIDTDSIDVQEDGKISVRTIEEPQITDLFAGA